MHKAICQIGELSKDGVFIFDLDTKKFIYLNKPFASLFSLEKKRILENPALLIPLISSEDDQYLRFQLAALEKESVINSTEFRLVKEEDSVKHLRCDAYLMEETSQVAGFVRDITKEKQHEDYIINYGARKDTLLDMMAHNLAGPLVLSQNILQWIQQKYKDKTLEEMSSQLSLIQQTTKECLDIINDFLRQEHIESEQIYVKKTRFDVLDRIRNTLEKLVATNKNKEFHLISDLENLNICTDSVKFFQVIHNLVSNAIKFTPDNGRIDIIVEETKNTFIIRVRDNGIGIPPELHEKLFEKRTPSSRNGVNNEASTGLGLSIVKTLTELLGGTIGFETKVDNGSVFSIELPKE